MDLDRTLSASPDGAPSGQPGYTGPSEIGGYRIIRQIGEGGMGTVFEAFERKMNRRVALKILARHLSETESGGDRFAREAWIAGRLNHPNLVRVFERGEDRNASFFSMEFVDGGSLHDVIRTLRAFGKDEARGLVFGTREYLAWAIGQIVQTARGLDYAHRQGVVHRDIKPMNILLNREPAGVKVADFGLAVDLKATRMTNAGTVMGTVAYMAPEQIRGRNDLVDGRTDVFALGITLFELLTLELPFSGATQQLYLNAVLTLQARRPRKLNERVGRDLEIVIQKAIEKDPKDRYATIGAFADDLENVLHFRPIAARPPGTATRVAKWVRRRPMHAALAGLLIVALPTIGVLGARAYQHNRLMARMQVDAWREETTRLLHDNRFDAALDPLGKILAARPRDPDARRDRSLSYARLAMAEKDPRRRDELQGLALADITAAADQLPRARWPFRVRAFLLKSFGDDAGAARDEATTALNGSADLDYYEIQIEGILALTARDDAKAVKEFGEMIRMRSDAADARLWRGSAWERLGEPAKAMTDYEVAAALKPSDLVSRLNLARLKTVSGSLDEGEEMYRQALRLAPADARAHEGLSANLLEQGRAAATAGDAARAGGLFGQAEQEARAALAGDPALGWARLNLGASLMERNRLLPAPDPALVNEAIAEYGRAIALREAADPDPRDEIRVKALVNQCDARIQMKSLVEAERDCLRVVELQPGDASARYNLAGVYALSGRPDDAFRALEKDYELGDRDWQYLAADPWFAAIRTDRRFASLLDRMKRSPAGR